MVVSLYRTLIGIALGLVASGILIAISGVNPFTAYGALIKGAFGSKYAISNVLVRSSRCCWAASVWRWASRPACGTPVSGAICTWAPSASALAMFGVMDLGLSPIVHILLCMLAAMFFAGVWGAIPGFLKAYMNVNEVTCTIMMNYIAIYLTNWVVSSFAHVADTSAFYPMSKSFAETTSLPILLRGSSLHPGPFIGIVLCLLFHFLLNYTSFGFRTKMLGSNPFAAQYSGVNAKRQIMIVIIIGAVIGGLSGAIEVLGLKHRVYMEFVTGVGYESAAVALLAGGNPPWADHLRTVLRHFEGRRCDHVHRNRRFLLHELHHHCAVYAVRYRRRRCGRPQNEEDR